MNTPFAHAQITGILVLCAAIRLWCPLSAMVKSVALSGDMILEYYQGKIKHCRLHHLESSCFRKLAKTGHVHWIISITRTQFGVLEMRMLRNVDFSTNPVCSLLSARYDFSSLIRLFTEFRSYLKKPLMLEWSIYFKHKRRRIHPGYRHLCLIHPHRQATRIFFEF